MNARPLRIGPRILAALAARGWRLPDLQRAIAIQGRKVSIPSLSQWCNSRVTWTDADIACLVDALGTPTDYFTTHRPYTAAELRGPLTLGADRAITLVKIGDVIFLREVTLSRKRLPHRSTFLTRREWRSADLTGVMVAVETHSRAKRR